MVQVSASREGRMPIFQLCPVHTEPDWWISSEKKSIKPLQQTCKLTLKVKLTLPGVVTSLQNGQTWEKYPEIKVWRFIFQLSQLKSRWRIVVIPVRSKMLHEGLTVWSPRPCSLVLPRPRLAGLSLLLLGSSETRSLKMKIIWERCHFYFILSLTELDSSKHNIETSFESIDHNWLK